MLSKNEPPDVSLASPGRVEPESPECVDPDSPVVAQLANTETAKTATVVVVAFLTLVQKDIVIPPRMIGFYRNSDARKAFFCADFESRSRARAVLFPGSSCKIVSARAIAHSNCFCLRHKVPCSTFALTSFDIPALSVDTAVGSALTGYDGGDWTCCGLFIAVSEGRATRGIDGTTYVCWTGGDGGV